MAAKKLFGIIGILLISAACNKNFSRQNSQNKTDPGSVATIPGPAAPLQPKPAQNQNPPVYATKKYHEKGPFGFTADASYPQIQNLSNKNIQADANKKIKAIVDGLVKESRPSDSPFPDSESSFVEIYFAVYQLTPKYLSLIFYWDSYTGGVHPNRGTISFNYGLEQGRELVMQDFVASGTNGLSAISQKVKDNLAVQFKERNISDEYLKSLSDSKGLLRDFILNNEVFTFVFDPYAVASYADGEFSVDIKYNDVKDVLRPDFLGEIPGFQAYRAMSD